jgi:Domain of Unknown Function (DUF1259)
MSSYASVFPDKLARRRRFIKSLSLVDCRADEKFPVGASLRGDPVKLAAALHGPLVLSKTPLTAPSGAAPSQIELDTALIDRTLGAKGKVNGGLYQVSLKRAGTVSDAGMAVPDAMGTAEAIKFQPTGDGKAAIAGDFVLTANEVNPVLRVLRDNGIEVTALHNHMLNDEPRDEVAKLAAGLRAALDKIDLARG